MHEQDHGQLTCFLKISRKISKRFSGAGFGDQRSSIPRRVCAPLEVIVRLVLVVLLHASILGERTECIRGLRSHRIAIDASLAL